MDGKIEILETLKTVLWGDFMWSIWRTLYEKSCFVLRLQTLKWAVIGFLAMAEPLHVERIHRRGEKACGKIKRYMR